MNLIFREKFFKIISISHYCNVVSQINLKEIYIMYLIEVIIFDKFLTLIIPVSSKISTIIL